MKNSQQKEEELTALSKKMRDGDGQEYNMLFPNIKLNFLKINSFS